jgi:cell shape-determining protein MreC
MDIVDLAYQIIDMDRENESLKEEVAHLEEINKQYSESLDTSDKSTKECIATIINAVLDPNSSINKQV